jgi:hypothetical protein
MSLIKKSDANPASVTLWHPNFRNFERLPDTKVVRTTFFVNVTSVAIAASLLILVGMREYRIMDLKGQIDTAKAEIAKATKDNTEALRLSKIFETEGKKIAEANTFTKRAMAPSAFVLLLGKTLLKEVQIESADMRYSGASGDQCVLRGIVAGSKDTASGAADKYVGILRNSPLIGSKFESVNMPSINPDPAGGFMRFEIVLKFKPAGKETKS